MPTGDRYSTEVITLDDLYYMNKNIEFKLNNEHTAIISENKVLVGCQEFSIDTIIELGQVAEKHKLENYEE